ncbi:trehalose-6-phosphate synthase [Nonlabens sp. YIK11]|uniref:bifunctional alpha,alpha-trehalose-phosphate synthase (UDP-forming)/trehalose-phosphatase n=1 Tax=Nonlabens sp. YIK11 TaxID=1453349 RepID=UPI0006DC5A68|nr:bifunctional alpha,alpha-trehalose-phosphate synthase (UDP-forming)/trehalose-phosphatase [Nonlabens sp. YIK11]KQC34223.1 trehalose-6-phosphate synthase [Nonlabens sp. YIK11]
MSKTIIVSNRLPLQLSIEDGKVSSEPSVGGLATGLKSVHRDSNGLWIGWTGLTVEETPQELESDIEKAVQNQQCAAVELTQSDMDGFYYGFSNRTIWPLYHYFMEYAEFDSENWEIYKSVNQKFADVVLENLEEGDNVWVHDYQLMLLPQLIKEKRPDVSIGFFLHIPFPSYEVFRTLPWRDQILKGLLGADLLGFHTYDYERHFLSSVSRILGHEVSFNEITYKDRHIKVDSFPMGIDYEKFHAFAKANYEQTDKTQSELQRRLDLHATATPDAKMILSIDRLDYTKGIANRLRAFEHFLEKYPDYTEKVRLVMLAVPSRSNVPQYQVLKKEIDELVGRINGKFSTVSWTPVWYFYRSMPFNNLIDLYTSCDVALITPIRDGMNLVAKEYIATRIDRTGVLILSEMAGASKEMNEALLINPNDINLIADTIKDALEMPEEEQKKRNKFMQKRLERYNVEKWASDFMTKLDSVKSTQSVAKATFLNEKQETEILERFKKANKRIFFLDYDGTLRGFVNNPGDAKPDQALLEMVEDLQSNEKNEVVVISGRDSVTLGEWFKDVPVTLIAEHGVLKKYYGKDWELTETMNNDWVPTIQPVMQNYVDRTPGTFIEEKNYSLAWHYRKADPELGEQRANDLSNVIRELTSNHGLSVLSGNKVIEIKSSNVHKGKASNNHILNKNYDFIFCIGDDWTDEFMFQDLPEDAVTVKVGVASTAARYYVDDTDHVRKVLTKFRQASS